MWLGEKKQFDKEGHRRPPHPDPPPTPTGADDTNGHKLTQRYTEAAEEFRKGDLPPIQTAHWLMKPPQRIRGTWEHPEQAAEWLGERLTEYVPRFRSQSDQDSTTSALHVSEATERLSWGGDVSLGFYVGQSQFLSLALVTCRNRMEPELPCPASA
ncbi:hypothetical protein [Streptomyces sp. NPDC050504]|uniref:hypothetical protein n=1 Tax=Streptomyces sp. NPDC050504 TaxID=3365618 RepID=UPI00379E9A65